MRVFFWGGRETKGHLLWGAKNNLLVPATAAIPFSRFFRRSVLPWFCGGQQSGVLLLIKHCGVAVSKSFPQLALSSQESVMIPVKRPLLSLTLVSLVFVSLPEFLDFQLFGETALVLNEKLGLFLANSRSPWQCFCATQAERSQDHRAPERSLR